MCTCVQVGQLFLGSALAASPEQGQCLLQLTCKGDELGATELMFGGRNAGGGAPGGGAAGAGALPSGPEASSWREDSRVAQVNAVGGSGGLWPTKAPPCLHGGGGCKPNNAEATGSTRRVLRIVSFLGLRAKKRGFNQG